MNFLLEDFFDTIVSKKSFPALFNIRKIYVNIKPIKKFKIWHFKIPNHTTRRLLKQINIRVSTFETYAQCASEHRSPCTARTLRLPYIRVTVHVRKWLKIASVRVSFLDFDMGVHEWASVVFPFIIRISNEPSFHSLRIVYFSYDDWVDAKFCHIFFIEHRILKSNRYDADTALYLSVDSHLKHDF